MHNISRCIDLFSALLCVFAFLSFVYGLIFIKKKFDKVHGDKYFFFDPQWFFLKPVTRTLNYMFGICMQKYIRDNVYFSRVYEQYNFRANAGIVDIVVSTVYCYSMIIVLGLALMRLLYNALFWMIG